MVGMILLLLGSHSKPLFLFFHSKVLACLPLPNEDEKITQDLISFPCSCQTAKQTSNRTETQMYKSSLFRKIPAGLVALGLIASAAKLWSQPVPQETRPA